MLQSFLQACQKPSEGQPALDCHWPLQFNGCTSGSDKIQALIKADVLQPNLLGVRIIITFSIARSLPPPCSSLTTFE